MSTITIEEVNQAGSDSRKIVLSGPSLPFMGAAWSSEMKVVTTWYPGNGDEASQQVLGPRELPSKWQGDWRRTMMGSVPARFDDGKGSDTLISDPQVLADAFEEVIRGGSRLRVTWEVSDPMSVGNGRGSAERVDMTLNGRIVREGRVTSYGFKYSRSMTDIEWEMQFDWLGRGKTTQNVTSTRADTVASDSADLKAKLKKIVDAQSLAQQARSNPSHLTLGQLQQIANTPAKLAESFQRQVLQLSNQVGQLVAIAETVRNQPAHVLNSGISAAHNTISIANRFRQQLTRTPPELLCTKTRYVDVVRAAKGFSQQHDNAADLSRAAQLFANRIQEARGTANRPGAGAIPVRRTVSGQAIKAVYQVKAGDTPQRISLRFYGNPDHAADILRANRLPWSTPAIAAGKVIIIPVLSGAPATSGTGG